MKESILKQNLNKKQNNKHINIIEIFHFNKLKKDYNHNPIEVNHNNNYNKLFIHSNKIYILWNLIFISLINTILANNSINNKRNLENQYIISLTLYGDGYQYIVNPQLLPDLVYFDNKELEIDQYGYINIENGDYLNEITLKWTKKITSFENLFNGVTWAIEIDLSQFDTSEITSMKNMFSNCYCLENINFTNINTSSVTDMSYMFSDSYIMYLNLSNFDTSKVITMGRMFWSMDISSIDITNFNTSQVVDMSYLFSGCFNLKSLNLSNLNTSKVNTMEGLFMNCWSLNSLEITNLDTSSVIIMTYMFYNTNFTSLDLSNFNTSSVELMQFMFAYNNNLKFLNLSGFNTYNVYDMSSMFLGSSQLISLDLSSFSFNQVIANDIFSECLSLRTIKFSKKYKMIDDVNHMFNNCKSLLSLDLYNFDFELIENMGYMFYGCNSITSIDLSNTEAFLVNNMEYMFYGCNSLKELNFNTWITSSVSNIKSMFYNCFSLISLDLRNFDTSLVTDMKELFYNCIQLTSINLDNFDTHYVNDMESMFYGCISLLSLNLSSFDTSNVVNMKSIFYSCSKLTSLDLSNFNIENVVDISFMFYGCSSLVYINFYNFNGKSLKKNNNIFFGIADNLIFCIKDRSNNIISKLSVVNCPIIDCSNNWKENKKRIIYNNNSCIDNCQNDDIYKYEYEYYCYDSCPKGTHSSNKNKFLCEEDITGCMKKNYFLNLEDNSCVEICNSEDFFNEKCTLNIYNPEQKIILIENIINEIKNNFTDKLIIEVANGKNFIIKDNDTLYQLTSSFNQNNENISLIKFGECENILRDKYDISKEEDLIIFKIEENIEGLLIPLIEYEIFNPKTKEKLNLNFCENEKIDIYIPLSINENILYIYDKNNNYYNDICNTVTTEYGTDIILYDRKKEYNNQKISICAKNCIFITYFSDNQTLVCQCKALGGITFNKSNLINYFEIEKNIINLNILKCAKLLFSNEGLKNNIASYIIILIIILHISLIIYYYFKGYKFLYNQIEDLINLKKYEFEKSFKIDLSKEKLKKNSFNLISPLKKNKINVKVNNSNSSSINYSNDIIMSKDIIKEEQIEKENNYNDYEINIISYEIALEYDKRTFFQYYISLIKVNYILIFTFKRSKDYNSYEIKICLFFFLFALYMFTNTMFFNDHMLHKIYEDRGKFNFIYVLPRMIYSVIICSIINIILKILVLSQNNILEIKNVKNKDKLSNKIINVVKCLRIKFFLYFLFSTIFLILSWFYLATFCIVYKNTQLYLLKVILISYSISLLYPFIIYLVPVIFRISGLKTTGKCLYNYIKIVQHF